MLGTNFWGVANFLGCNFITLSQNTSKSILSIFKKIEKIVKFGCLALYSFDTSTALLALIEMTQILVKTWQQYLPHLPVTWLMESALGWILLSSTDIMQS